MVTIRMPIRQCNMTSMCTRARPIRPRPCAASKSTTSTAAAQPRTLYELLGVPPEAVLADVKAAYRTLASLYHPDVNPTNLAAEKFQAIVLAYDILQDEGMRRLYDQHGLRALGRKYAFLQDYLAAGTWQGVVGVGKRGKDLYTVAGLEFREAITGVERIVSVKAQGLCPDCKGTGISQSAAVERCEVCHGSGEILRSQWQTAGPSLLQLGVCPACGGKGSSAVQFCSKCDGKGRRRMLRHVTVRIPAGVHDGQVLRVQRQGDAGMYGGQPGDLFVKLQVYNLENVERRGDDLYSSITVGVFDALLGTTVTVPTVRGERLLTIPPGTQHGSQLCLRGAGVASTKGGFVSYGHHYWQVSVSIPTFVHNTEEAAHGLLRELALLQTAANIASQGHLYNQAFGLDSDLQGT